MSIYNFTLLYISTHQPPSGRRDNKITWIIFTSGTIGALFNDRGEEMGDVISWKTLLLRRKGHVELASTPAFHWKCMRVSFSVSAAEFCLIAVSISCLNSVFLSFHRRGC